MKTEKDSVVLLQLCREKTNLTAMHCELIGRIYTCLGIVGDLAKAHVTVYAEMNTESRKYVVLSQIKPHTVYSPVEMPQVGEEISVVEEPLVSYTFEHGKSIRGKREWSLGNSYDMYTYPIHSGNEVIAVVTLTVYNTESEAGKYGEILETVRLLLNDARKPQDSIRYRPISAGDGIIICDKYNRIILANLSADRIYKVLGVGNLIGLHLYDRQLTMHITKESTSPGIPDEKEIEVGGLILMQRDIPIMEGGTLLRRIVIIRDVTETRQKDREIRVKSAVIQEIHHRVKNNLQTIASLLRLQSRRSSSPEVREALKESVNRILSISVVHEYLSQQDGEHIDVVEITKNILKQVAKNMVSPDFKLETRFDGPDLVLPSKQAGNIAVCINELVLNTLKHAFKGRNHGLIGLSIEENEDSYSLDIYDDGVGVQEKIDIDKSRSLGLQIVRTFVVEDMGGSFELSGDENGTHGRITIPKNLDMGEDDE